MQITMGCLLLSTIVILAVAGSGDGERRCHQTFSKTNHLTIENVDTSEDVDGENPVHGSNRSCPKATNYCYAFWMEDTRNGSARNITIFGQGCWRSSRSYSCENSKCIASLKPSKVMKDAHFCCCNEDFCNENMTHKIEEVVAATEVTPAEVVKHMDESYLLIIITLVILLLIIVTGIMIMRKDFKRKSVQNLKGNQDSLHLMESGDPYGSNFTVENLRLDGIIGQGRYGAVWKGFIGDQQVAVKIFPSHHKSYFYNELDIYCLPFMAHPSLLTYFGCDERTGFDGNTEYFLFLSLAPNGSVQDYLRSNVLDWETFCRMALSIAKGIAYLHTDIQKGDKMKPCVTHRDLNTKNILVKEDLSCVICDLGFATKISGSTYYYNGEERHAETKSINDVGTLRYMSPEVLEGAVNLRDCETSLKQIDVYALGLILWELSSRCGDFYPAGVECGPYKLPFEAEIGHPSFEQMQILVCRHKARPLFPDHWRDTPTIRTVKETIEDCWDQDAEARLTALCVEERFHELCGLSERQKSTLFPNGMSPFGRTSFVQRDSQNVLISDKDEVSCVSESTVETLLAISPANPQIHLKNSNQYHALCPSVQPYQGRNPCLERNLMLPHTFDSNSGELIDKSQKHIGKNIDSSVIVNDYLNLYVANSTQNFSNPSFSTYSTHSEPISRSNVPIPFLQNVNADNSCQMPKRSNVPKVSGSNVKRVTWRNFMKVFEAKMKGSDVSPQIDCNANSNLIVNESSDTVTTPTASLEVALTRGKPETKVARQDIEKLRNSLKSNVESCESLGIQNVKRPNTLDLTRRKRDNRQRNNPLNNLSSPLKSGKRHSLNINSTKKREERAAKAKSLSGVEEFDKMTLLDDEDRKSDVKKSLEEVFCMENRNDSQLKDPNARIKTPGDVPLAVRKIRSERYTARFSLYDDRIMSGQYDETLYSCDYPSKCGSKILNSLEDVKFSQNI